MSETKAVDSESDLRPTAVAVTLSKAAVISNLKERDVSAKLKAEAMVVEYARRKKHASVLVPLIIRGDGAVDVLLTVRAKHLRTHGGEVAFPGGKQDEEDADETATALREAWEEVGLHQADIEVVSHLPPVISSAGYYITPITAVIPEDFTPTVNRDEVDDVFRVPLMDFLKHDHHESRPTGSVGRFALIHIFRHTIDRKLYVTYGLTAYLCIVAASCVFRRVPDFEMEPGFDPANLLQSLIDFIKREMSSQLKSSGNKL